MSEISTLIGYSGQTIGREELRKFTDYMRQTMNR
jgi:hypothetical protein